MKKSRAPYPAVEAANAILKHAGYGEISPLMLQKLLYFSHGWYLAIIGKPLIQDRVEAWDWGPVIPSVYHQFKEYGNSPIDEPYMELDYDYDEGWKLDIPQIPEDDKQAHQLIEAVMSKYGQYTPIQLSNLTHVPGSPWAQVREQNQGIKSIPIPNNVIRDYFVKIGRQQHT